MSKKLALVAVCGLVIGAVLLASAALVGGPELRDREWNFAFDNWGVDRCEASRAGRRGERSLDWTGGDRVTFDLPVNARYRRGEGDKVVVRGDAALLAHVEIDDGRIRLNCRMSGPRERLEVTLPGREFREFSLRGSGTVTLDGIDQARLEVHVAGSGNVTASGRADRFEYALAGSGKGNFSNLEADSVEVSIAGSGDAEVKPRDRLVVNIAGSGDVTLHSEPKDIVRHIAGSGDIIHLDGRATRASGVPGIFKSEHVDRPTAR
jgi:hypothetical protein